MGIEGLTSGEVSKTQDADGKGASFSFSLPFVDN